MLEFLYRWKEICKKQLKHEKITCKLGMHTQEIFFPRISNAIKILFWNNTFKIKLLMKNSK